MRTTMKAALLLSRNSSGPAEVAIPGPLSITPTVGAEVLTNGDFSAWSGDNPVGWSVSGEVGSDPMVTEVAPDGSAGTGAARYYSSATAAQPRTTQSVLTVGTWYLTALTMSARTNGGARVEYGSSAQAPLGFTVQTVGTFSGVARAVSTFFSCSVTTSTADYVIDSISCKPLTLSTLFDILSDKFVPRRIEAAITRIVNMPSGVVHYADDNNFVIAYIDGRGNLRLDKCVAGTWTQVGTTTTTYSAGALLELTYDPDAKTYSVYYNDSATPKLNALSVADAVFTTAKGAGLFSTHADNSFVDFYASP